MDVILTKFEGILKVRACVRARTVPFAPAWCCGRIGWPRCWCACPPRRALGMRLGRRPGAIGSALALARPCALALPQAKRARIASPGSHPVPLLTPHTPHARLCAHGLAWFGLAHAHPNLLRVHCGRISAGDRVATDAPRSTKTASGSTRASEQDPPCSCTPLLSFFFFFFFFTLPPRVWPAVGAIRAIAINTAGACREAAIVVSARGHRWRRRLWLVAGTPAACCRAPGGPGWRGRTCPW